MKLNLIAAVALLGSAMPASATLLVNGNFDANLNGWTVGRIGGNTGFVQTNGTFFNLAAPAAQFRSSATNFYTLAQNIATTVGTRYRLTYFALNQRSTFNQIDVTTGGLTTTSSFAEEFEGFTQFTQFFTATSDTSLVRFAVRHGGVSGNFFFIDDAVLTEFVPEPETWAMLIAGFGMVGAAARRRRRFSALVA